MKQRNVSLRRQTEMLIKHEFYPKREQSIQMKNMSIVWSEFGQIIEFQQSFNDYSYFYYKNLSSTLNEQTNSDETRLFAQVPTETSHILNLYRMFHFWIKFERYRNLWLPG